MTSESYAAEEARSVKERYARRKKTDLYSALRPEVILSTQERQRVMLQLFTKVCGFTGDTLRYLKLLDVGCGYGGHLLDFLRLGLSPENLSGIELLRDRIEVARTKLPATVNLYYGEASATEVAVESQDVVFQSVVFSSLLNADFQSELAQKMWSWVRPGGGILWYDFIYDNPKNPDVRGVPVQRVRELFPQGRITVRRLTLAPPISRRACKIHPAMYHICNAFPFLRTHALCWIAKSSGD
jgi:2-polyprenyl-3-methyl-5-hydroxy-6-metoxy-1,4-benzoquinol methylase